MPARKGKPKPQGTGAVKKPAAVKKTVARPAAVPRAKPKTPPAKRPAPSKTLPPVAVPAVPAVSPPATPPPSVYGAHRDKMAAASRERSTAGREVGPHDPPADPKRKDACRTSFRLFCENYLPDIFPLAWAAAHLTAIERLQTCAIGGGQFSFAMPRGMGKTKLCEAGALWAGLYGHRRFVVLVGASGDAAEESLNNIKLWIETNEALHEDFGEVTHYVRALEGISQRANAQTLNGQRTRLNWKGKAAVFPTVPGSAASGARVRVAGITGRIRGLSAVVSTGESIRPDLAIVDDPQTDESADSAAQVAKLERVLNGAVLGLAGPKKKIAAFVPCTVIAPGDLADRILDRDRNPVWHGQRSRMVESFPTNAALWDEYADLRKASQRSGGKGEPANEMYRTRRAEMDLGAAVSWPERFNDDEVSAVQHAMNLRIDRGREAFDAECQNDPKPRLAGGQLPDLLPATFAEKVNGLARGVVPVECSRLTAMIDCGKGLLWYAVSGWTERFAGAVVEYGTWPRQGRAYFTKSDAGRTIEAEFPALSEEAALWAALKALTGELLGTSYTRADGGAVPIGLCLVDSGYQEKTVSQFCRQSPHLGRVAPSKGYGITAARPPMDTWKKKHEAERKGDNWRQRPDRLVLFDTNHWKTFVSQRLLTPEGGIGALYLNGPAADHQLFADHLTAEYRIATEGQGRRLIEWGLKPNRDNDWFDCVVGSAVAASVQGVRWDPGLAAGEASYQPPARKKVRLSDKFKEKHGPPAGARR
jgi:hypothetical protein